MTNRTKFTLFTELDDPDIDGYLDVNERVIIHANQQFYELTKHKACQTVYYKLCKFPYVMEQNSITPKIFASAFINRDLPDLTNFLHKFLK